MERDGKKPGEGFDNAERTQEVSDRLRQKMRWTEIKMSCFLFCSLFYWYSFPSNCLDQMALSNHWLKICLLSFGHSLHLLWPNAFHCKMEVTISRLWVHPHGMISSLSCGPFWWPTLPNFTSLLSPFLSVTGLGVPLSSSLLKRCYVRYNTMQYNRKFIVHFNKNKSCMRACYYTVLVTAHCE